MTSLVALAQSSFTELFDDDYPRHAIRGPKVVLKKGGSSQPLRLEIDFDDFGEASALYKPSSDDESGLVWVVEQEGKHAFTDGMVKIDWYPEE